MRNDIFNRKDEIIKWINENQPKTFICKNLNCKYETLNTFLLNNGIDYKGNKGLKGKKTNNNKKSALYYINNNITITANRLKNKLIEEKIKEKKCEICENDTWNNINIPLELHHIDCNHYNNNLNNLIILCPNCHTQEHIKNKKDNNKEFNINYNIKKVNIKNKTKKNNKDKIKHLNMCVCGKEIDKRSIRCKDCENKRRKEEIKNRPIKEQLLEDIKNLGYSGTGRKYNVSDNCIRKWIK